MRSKTEGITIIIDSRDYCRDKDENVFNAYIVNGKLICLPEYYSTGGELSQCGSFMFNDTKNIKNKLMMIATHRNLMDFYKVVIKEAYNEEFIDPTTLVFQYNLSEFNRVVKDIEGLKNKLKSKEEELRYIMSIKHIEDTHRGRKKNSF